MGYYQADTSCLRYAPIYAQCACISACALLMTLMSGCACILLSPSEGGADMWAALNENIKTIWRQIGLLSLLVAIVMGGIAIASYRLIPDTIRIRMMVRQRLYQPAYGNPLHLRDGDRLPRVSCVRLGAGMYDLIISAQQGATVETILNAAPAISSALIGRYQQYAVIQMDADLAFNRVTFRVDDVKADRSVTYHSAAEMCPESSTMLRVDQTVCIDLTTSGSILVAGKTRSGKTTGVIALLMQVLACGPDDHGSSVIIIDPKCAELSRLPHTVTLDDDGEATAIVSTLEAYVATIRQRQKVLNDLSEQSGDAVKWWDAGFHPSFLFLDEYVSCRSIMPKKAAKDSNYCLDTFDGLVKRIVTTGASAGCYMIISIAEASVQEGGLPAMLRSAMSTKVLFRPTQTEGRLMWDAEKLDNFVGDKVYGPGDAWFSSTDGIHDAVTYVHFPHMEFPVYRELGRLLEDYNYWPRCCGRSPKAEWRVPR